MWEIYLLVSDSVDQDQAVRFVQSDICLHWPQRVIASGLATQGLSLFEIEAFENIVGTRTNTSDQHLSDPQRIGLSL